MSQERHPTKIFRPTRLGLEREEREAIALHSNVQPHARENLAQFQEALFGGRGCWRG